MQGEFDQSSGTSNDCFTDITSNSRGLGYSFIEYYAAQPNTTVIGIVRNKEAAEARVAKSGFKNVTILKADITDGPALQAAADATAKITGGSLDLLINNAALAADDDTAYVEPQNFSPEVLSTSLQRSFNANVVGIGLTTNAFLPLIRAGKDKKIITIGTGLADVDLVVKYELPAFVPYAVSKAATNMLVAKYHAALGPTEGITCVCISPGVVDTREGKPMTQEEIEGTMAMGAKFMKYAPEFKGPITGEESVGMVAKVIEGATVETLGGAFVSHFGNKQWL